jgi:hypothetical protein
LYQKIGLHAELIQIVQVKGETDPRNSHYTSKKKIRGMRDPPPHPLQIGKSPFKVFSRDVFAIKSHCWHFLLEYIQVQTLKHRPPGRRLFSFDRSVDGKSFNESSAAIPSNTPQNSEIVGPSRTSRSAGARLILFPVNHFPPDSIKKLLLRMMNGAAG